MTMMIAYVKTATGRRFTGTATNRAYYKDVISSNSRHAEPTAHVPEGMFARVTLCGKAISELVETADDANIKKCKVCQARLNGLVKRLPGCTLLQEIFGENKFLLIGDH